MGHPRVGAGLAAGFALSEWTGGVNPARVRGAARRFVRCPPAAHTGRLRPGRRSRPPRRAQARRSSISRSSPFSRGVVELRGWVPTRTARPCRQGRAGGARHRPRHEQLPGARRGRPGPAESAASHRPERMTDRSPRNMIRPPSRPTCIACGSSADSSRPSRRARRGPNGHM